MVCLIQLTWRVSNIYIYIIIIMYITIVLSYNHEETHFSVYKLSSWRSNSCQMFSSDQSMVSTTSLMWSGQEALMKLCMYIVCVLPVYTVLLYTYWALALQYGSVCIFVDCFETLNKTQKILVLRFLAINIEILSPMVPLLIGHIQYKII